ncbi:serine protease snake-like [Zophobas morio]|uniref:serine protease snake-like n=1 Tax=Zophobas morio TaxID=2755281 RepID=UPI0030836546
MYSFLIIVVVVLVKNVYTQGAIGDPCTVKASNSPGRCKLLTQCGEIRDEIVFNQKLPQICGFQETQPIVCCPITRRPGYISEKKCREYASYTKENRLCGHNIAKRVINGRPAGRVEFPHMALLAISGAGSLRWLCGGSLISERYVLTAGRCLAFGDIDEPNLVLFGITSFNDPNHMQKLRIGNNLIHPGFNRTHHNHDIGLILLHEPVEINSYVRPACLNTHFDIPATKVMATGWGSREYAVGVSEELFSATLDVAEYKICNKSDANTRRRKRGLNDIHICTGQGNGQKDTCQGDSGGALQIYHNKDPTRCMYDIVGVTSFRKGCSRAPSVHTRVSEYIKWIEDIVWPENSE